MAEAYDPAIFLKKSKDGKYLLGNFAVNLIVSREDVVALLRGKDKDGKPVESIRASLTGYLKKDTEEKGIDKGGLENEDLD